MSDDMPASILDAQRRLEEAKSQLPEKPDPSAAARELLAKVIPLDPDRLPLPDPEPYRYEPKKDRGYQRAVEAARRGAIMAARFPLGPGDIQRIVDGKHKNTRALEVVQAWSKACSGNAAARRILVLLGPPGTGKTFAAASLGTGDAWDDHVYGNGWRGRWTSMAYVKVRDLCRLYRSEWGPEREAYEALLESPIVVVDELGTGVDHELERRAVHDIVDERQGTGKTLLIGNLSRAEFLGGWSEKTPDAGRYDARTYDRLRAVGALREVGGDSLRRGSL